MDADKLARQLKLIALLAQNRELTIDELSSRVGMSRRTIYRYLDAFRSLGFSVVQEGKRYRLDHRSPFFQKITDKTHFTDAEALTLNQVLNSVFDNSPQVRHLREKLANLYDDKVLAHHGVDERTAHNIAAIYRAIREERVCILRSYTSPHSGRTDDRTVEPFLLLSGNTEVRCYEIASAMNKTFKISRAESVEVVELLWSHKAEHKAFHTDMFHFSGEVRLPISLRLGPLAANVLREEYPQAENQLTRQADGRYKWETWVCSYKGVGRFVVGLFDDIEIVGPQEFATYMQERIAALARRIATPQARSAPSRAATTQ